MITIVGANNDSDSESDIMQALTEDPGRDEENDADHLEKMTDYKSYSKVIYAIKTSGSKVCKLENGSQTILCRA